MIIIVQESNIDIIIVQESDIDEVVVTNTVPLENQKMITNKIRTVDISILLAEAIR